LEFTVESVIPGLVLGDGLSLRPVLDPVMVNKFCKNNMVKEYNLLGQQVFQATNMKKKETQKK